MSFSLSFPKSTANHPEYIYHFTGYPGIAGAVVPANFRAPGPALGHPSGAAQNLIFSGPRPGCTSLNPSPFHFVLSPLAPSPHLQGLAHIAVSTVAQLPHHVAAPNALSELLCISVCDCAYACHLCVLHAELVFVPLHVHIFCELDTCT